MYYNLVNLIIAQVFGSLIKRPEGSRPVMVVIDEMAGFVPGALCHIYIQEYCSLEEVGTSP